MNEIVFCDDKDVPLMNMSGTELDKLNSSKAYYHLVDNQHRCCYVNQAWQDLHNLGKKFSTEGKLYSEIPHKAFETCSDQFEEHDNQVIWTGNTIPSLEIHEYDNIGWLATFLEVKPYIIQEEISGLICHARKLPDYYITQYQKFKAKLPIDQKKHEAKLLIANPDELHDAEFDTIYLLMLGLKIKQIAEYRDVSANTIYATLTNIRFKLGLNKNKQIFDFAITHDWYNYIPHMFRNVETAFRLNKLPSS